MTPHNDPFGGEYGAPDLRLSGVWSLLSFACALPGLLFPWLYPLVLYRYSPPVSFRTLLLSIPAAAVLGMVLGLVGVWRARSLGRSGRVALWALIVNAIVLACCVVALVVTVRGLWR
jgi:hypothetical protein